MRSKKELHRIFFMLIFSFYLMIMIFVWCEFWNLICFFFKREYSLNWKSYSIRKTIDKQRAIYIESNQFSTNVWWLINLEFSFFFLFFSINIFSTLKYRRHCNVMGFCFLFMFSCCKFKSIQKRIFILFGGRLVDFFVLFLFN
jgi:hypothetical protein